MFKITLILAASCLSMGANAAFSQGNSAPAQSKPAAESRKAITTKEEFVEALQEQMGKFRDVMPPAPTDLANAEARKKALPGASPVLHEIVKLVREHGPKYTDIPIRETEFIFYGLVLGDAGFKAELDKKAKVKETEHEAKLTMAAVATATSDAAGRKAAYDGFIKLLKTETTVAPSLIFSVMMITDATTDEVNALAAAVTEYKDQELVAALKQQAQSKIAQTILPEKLNKGFAIAGKLVSGEDFTTESMKGKVVLVDFWATWCGPCMRALPEVIEMYKKYHDQGLEVVGVSCDNELAALKAFMEKRKADVPWPQVFNTAKPGWHEIATNLGIDGIPRMLLIDRKGVLRDIDAHEKMSEMIPKLLAEK